MITEFGYKKLEKNLIDIIKEEQAKLGFIDEDIRLYYPLSSLNHFFDAVYSEDEMLRNLTGFSSYTSNTLGDIQVTAVHDRFCFYIPKQGVRYVHETIGKNEFIYKLVNLIADHDCTMDDIKKLFIDASPDVYIEKINNGEFDTLIRFKDNSDDRYYYCFKDEGCNIIYHRFLPEDYEDLVL